MLVTQAFLNSFLVIMGSLCIAINRSKKTINIILKTVIILGMITFISKNIIVPITTLVVAILMVLTGFLKLFK